MIPRFVSGFVVAVLLLLCACSDPQATPQPTSAVSVQGTATTGATSAVSGSASPAANNPPPQVGSGGQITPNAPSASGQKMPGFYFYVQEFDIWQSGAAITGGSPQSATALGGTRITSNPQLSLAQDPALSPDGAKLVYSYSPPPQMVNNKPVVGADINQLDLKTKQITTLIARKNSYDFLVQPQWSRDGRFIYYGEHGPVYDSQNRVTGEAYRLQLFDTTTGKSEKVLDDGIDPAISPDGKILAFVTLDPQSYEYGLALYDLVSQKVTRLNRQNQNFASFNSPRWSPDGSLLAFSAVGGPGVNLSNLQAQPTTPPAQSAPRYSFDPAALTAHLIPAPHGTPYDLWLWPMSPTPAANPRRLTTVYEDQPIPAWSEDGKTVGFIAGNGLYSIAPDGTGLKRYAERGGHGGFAWRDK